MKVSWRRLEARWTRYQNLGYQDLGYQDLGYHDLDHDWSASEFFYWLISHFSNSSLPTSTRTQSINLQHKPTDKTTGTD
ncbi:MAG: hypothetical protein MH252_11840 [Thermosynechococcaceae cyanobacterium MS004]|nr:hypothetical protein [Thermosynechococcaceae cyanobacterium MS004]